MRMFSNAWEELYRKYPQHAEAGAFYGLSLVAIAEAGVDETQNRNKAIAVLDPLFRAFPDDPGFAHYLIHATDTPKLAQLGWQAARKYANIAPSSAHALHMPSHIFVRLGLWRESIESNRAAARAAAQAAKLGDPDRRYQVHAMDFLDYSCLQAGDERSACEITSELKEVIGASAQQIANYQSDFRARKALELHHWREAESLMPGPQPRSQQMAYLVRVIGAAGVGDVRMAKESFYQLEAATAKPTTAEGMASFTRVEDRIYLREARAWIAFAQKDIDTAIQILRATAAYEETVKMEPLTMPAREMLADMLLQLKQGSHALREYELELAETPNRFDALYGVARAAESIGRTETARQYFSELIAISTTSADRLELLEAKKYVLAAKMN